MEKEQFLKEITVAEIVVTYKSIIKPSLRPKITGAESAYQLLVDTWDASKIELVEQFKVMLLNRAHRVLGICTLTSGCVTGTIADPKQVFSVALITNATHIILAHNHPSGSATPSRADVELTTRMKVAGELLELKVLDHLIVTTDGFYSFATEGTL
jgi:DNA repair protein RadC